jgi:hypothetical protein
MVIHQPWAGDSHRERLAIDLGTEQFAETVDPRRTAAADNGQRPRQQRDSRVRDERFGNDFDKLGNEVPVQIRDETAVVIRGGVQRC